MFQIRYHGQNIAMTPTLIAHAESALGYAFDRFLHIVRDADLTLIDVNGPKGGVDKECRILIHLYPRGLIVVRSQSSDEYAAIRGSCDKARFSISKRIAKFKKRRIRPSRSQFLGEHAAYDH